MRPLASDSLVGSDEGLFWRHTLLSLFLVFAILAQGSASTTLAQERFDYAVVLPGRTFTPEPGIRPADRTQLQPLAAAGTPTRIIVQFTSPPTTETLEGLAANGVRLLSYVSGNAWYAVLSDSVALDFQSASVVAMAPDLGTIRWLGTIDPQDKIDSSLAADGPGSWAELPDGRVRLSVDFYRDVSPEEARAILTRYGAEVTISRDWRSSFDIVVEPSGIETLSAENSVMAVAQYPPPKQTYSPNDGSTAWTNTVNVWNAGIAGQGVVVSLWDEDEVDDGHQDLQGRVTFGEAPPTNTFSDHATHVAGTMAGDGTANPVRTGHASQAAEIVSFDFNDNVPAEIRAAIVDHDIDLANNSWGYTTGWTNVGLGQWQFVNNQGNFGDYIGIASDLDQIVREEQRSLLFAAGNDRTDPTGGQQNPAQPADWDQGVGNNGFDTMSPLAGAKNVIGVGAIQDPGGAMALFSNWGPTDDERIKPDVVAPGVAIFSADGGTTSSYRPSSGTSMATPAVSGIAALLIQAFREEYHGSWNAPERPLPSSIKALLIHSARDLGNLGPDFQFGWGGVDAEAANELVENRMLLEEELQNTGDQHEFVAHVPPGEPNPRVTLVWDDVAGPTLVNDLDLTLTSPNGTVYQPWVLDPTPGNWANAATTGVDRTNNVEQIVADSASAGRWVTRVRAVRIDPTAVPPNQQYSLIQTFITPGGFSRCITFEDLTVGTTYTYGDIFSSAGVPISLRMFTWGNGQQTTGNYAEVANQLMAGGSGNDLQANNVNLDFAFGQTVNGLNLAFGEYGGNLNLEVNGDFRNFADFSDIHGQSIGGVNASVVGLGNDKGKLTLDGTINSFVIGGQELWIDNVCPDSVIGDGRRLGVSLHGGLAVPFGTLDSTNGIGPTINLDLVYRLTSQLFADLRLGYSFFPGSGAASDFDVINASVNLKVIPVQNFPWFFVNGGPGQYYLNSSTWDTGYNLGVGLRYPVSPDLDFELTGNYHATTGSPKIEFGKLQIGLVWWIQ